VSLGLMTVSERPPAKYLVGPLVVRFLAYFLIFGPQTVSRGVEPACVGGHLQKHFFHFNDVLFFLVALFSLGIQLVFFVDDEEEYRRRPRNRSEAHS
jgi:hypothetical protein